MSAVATIGYIVMFVVIGVLFLLATLIMGKLVRPNAPNAEKKAIYECGEPTIGSSWVQFDLRFYVIALLFVIFDVEVAFFFPWAQVFGKAARVANTAQGEQAVANARENLTALGFASDDLDQARASAGTLTRLALGDLLVFFGVVLVGFAYLWHRGDIEWVRAIETVQPEVQAAQAEQAPQGEPGEPVPETSLV